MFHIFENIPVKVAVCLHERSGKVFPKTELRDLKKEILLDCISIFGEK